METHRFQVNGVELEAIGAGPPDADLVILLHGFPESGDAWERQVPALVDAGLRVLAPHQRGYAGSSKPAGLGAYRMGVLAKDVVALADAVGAQTFSLVGHDWGAAVAWHVATVHPQRVQRMAILNGPHPGTVGLHAMGHPTQLLRSWYIGAFQLPMLPEAVLRANDFALLGKAISATAWPGAIPPHLLERYRSQWAQPGALTAMLNWYRAIPFDLPTPMVRVHVPVTVVWGELDRFLERGLADAQVALSSKGTLVPLPTATHWLHHEEPEAVNAALVGALA